MPTRVGLLIAASFLVVISPLARADNKANKNQQERKDDERVRSAQNALDAARKDLNAAEKTLRQALQEADKADTRQDRAKVAVQKAKERAESELEDSTGIRKAVEQMKAAEEALQRAAEPILKVLHETAEYRAAEAAAIAAKERLKAIRLDVTLNEAERDAELSQLNKTLQAPRKLEQAATQGNAPYQSAKAAFESTQQEVARLRDGVRERLEQQPAVKQAIAELVEATRELAQAQKNVTAARQRVGQERRDVSNKQQALNNAKAADKKNDDNGKPKKKK